jgi:hypothetical protein
VSDVLSIADVTVEFPERADYNSLLRSFLAVYAIVQTLDERLTRLETRLLEEQFARPAALPRTKGDDDA